MAGQKKITVVISQAPGRNPAKRQLEEELAAALLIENDVDVSLVPHLNDLTADHTGLLYLRRVPGDVVILSWLYPRAARWILDRNGVKGQAGISLLKPAEAGDDDGTPAEEEVRPNAIGALDVPKRKLYCLDLRDQSEPRVYLDEIRRIAREASVQTVGLDLMQWIGGSPQPAQLQRYLNPFLPVNGAPAPGAAPEWRPGGWQVATADAAGRLYVLMNPHGRDGSHKDGGTEVWVMDPLKRVVLRRIALATPAIVELPKGTLGSLERMLEGERATQILDLVRSKAPFGERRP